jgi:membrane protein YqaA with SNARE-associated domain
VLCGAAKMDLREFIVVVFVGKLVKYAIVLNLAAMLMGRIGF